MTDFFPMMGRHMAEDDREEHKTEIDPHAAMMRIAEAAERHIEAKKGPRFKIGTWITPASDSRFFGHGSPHFVIDTRKADYCFDSERGVGTADYGAREDTLAIGFSRQGDAICAYWVSSADFVLWEEPK